MTFEANLGTTFPATGALGTDPQAVRADADPVLQGTSIDLPNFGGNDTVLSITSRRASRLNASAVSDNELNALLAARAELIDKKFGGSLTEGESNLLSYVDWSLDRIEDARMGWELDALEDALRSYERFATDLSSLTSALLANATTSS